MESGRVGSSPSTMPESREWADPFEILESAKGERNTQDFVNIHKELIVLFVLSCTVTCRVQSKYSSINLKVHKIEIFLASILKFVLFLCYLCQNIKI